jgi:hypothetical protein
MNKEDIIRNVNFHAQKFGIKIENQEIKTSLFFELFSFVLTAII